MTDAAVDMTPQGPSLAKTYPNRRPLDPDVYAATRAGRSSDTDSRFHEEWLGLAQPIEGLVFSVPVLTDAQIAPKIRSSCTAELLAHLEEVNGAWALRDVRSFFESFLGYEKPGALIDRADLPNEISFYAPEGHQEIRPSFAIGRRLARPSDDPFADFESNGAADKNEGTPESAESPYLALVWDLSSDADAEHVLSLKLDKPETATGTWSYAPTPKFERLLRHTGVPIGFLSNRRELRVIYAPPGETSAHLTFRFADLAERAGRPLVAALELIFHANRTYSADGQHTFDGLLRESRRRQLDVTKDLAQQVFEAVEILLEGFEQAGGRDCVGIRTGWLRAALEAPGDHLYQGILSVVLRLVFLLYSEDQSLVPIRHSTYSKHLSVFDLYERLMDDAGAHPESMHLRFGAYGRLISLFRAIFVGVRHGDLTLPPRRGRLFDPSAYPFLEGGLPGWTAAIALPEERSDVQLPSVSDETIHRVLHRLIVFKGHRLSYRSLDVEQIGAVYESLMGYQVIRASSPAVRLGKHRVWAEVDEVRSMKPTERKRFWKETCALSTSAQKKAEKAVKEAHDVTAVAEGLSELASGTKEQKDRHRVEEGRLVVQPTEERRRSGSHYTPRWLSEKVVQRTLEPILACLGESRTAEQILSLKICDPAMGSGAFLVAACRLLAQEVVDAWDRAGEKEALTEEHGDPLLHARRLVAQRCLYGVDKNAAAVELAKLSLWLVTLSEKLPFTFVDHALRHGDSLVGLDLDQIRDFHWQAKKQLDLCRPLIADSLEQALEHRDRILELAYKEDPASQREKQRLLEYAEQATERARVVADACIGAFFAQAKTKARETERDDRLDLVRRYVGGDESAQSQLQEVASDIREKHAPFHWMLEFPEVFYLERPDPLDVESQNRPAFMEAIVGNPPFAGKNGITEAGGNGYLDWLQTTHEGAHGNADLSAHFFLRSAHLLGPHGSLGLIATNTIAQGDTRQAGLRTLLQDGFKIYDATRSMMWPEPSAAVTVSVVHAAAGRPQRYIDTRRIDGGVVENINSRLRGKPERADALTLTANKGCSFVGTYVLGQGFTLTLDDKDSLEASNRKNAKRIFPYLGGQEVNTSPTQTHDRYVVSFSQMSLAEAERWPDLLTIVRDKVKPERDKLKNNPDGRRRKRYWWQFGRWTPALYEATTPLTRCLVNSQVSKHLVFAFQPTDRIFSHTLYVYPLEAFSAFTVLQSRVHEGWARLLSSSMKTDLRYAPSDCFETFPFPDPDPRAVIESLEVIGKRLYETRASFMVETDQGLTKTYNALKDSSNTDPPIVALRELHEEMDRAVLDTYGWTDIEVPPFCPRTEADRRALQAFEDEVIDRLYVLNAERAAQEQGTAVPAAKEHKRKLKGPKSTRQQTRKDRPSKRPPAAAKALRDRH